MPTFFQGNQKPCAASWAPTKLRSSNIDFSLQLLRTSLFTYPTFSKDVHSSSFIRTAARMTTRFAARLFAEVDSDAVAFGAEEGAYRFSPAATCPCLNPVRRIASHNLPPYRPTRHIPCIQPVTTKMRIHFGSILALAPLQDQREFYSEYSLRIMRLRFDYVSVN